MKIEEHYVDFQAVVIVAVSVVDVVSSNFVDSFDLIIHLGGDRGGRGMLYALLKIGRNRFL